MAEKWGIFDNLWIFRDLDPLKISHEEKLRLLINHISLFEKVWGTDKPYDVMKKFFKLYISDFPNATTLRSELMQSPTAKDAISYIQSQLLKN